MRRLCTKKRGKLQITGGIWGGGGQIWKSVLAVELETHTSQNISLPPPLSLKNKIFYIIRFFRTIKQVELIITKYNRRARNLENRKEINFNTVTTDKIKN